MKRLLWLALVACKSHEAPPPPPVPPLPAKLADQLGPGFAVRGVALAGQPMGVAIKGLEKAGGHLHPAEMSHQMYSAVDLDSDFGPLRVDLRGNDTVTGVEVEITLHGTMDALWSELDQAWGKPTKVDDMTRTYGNGVEVKPQGDYVLLVPAR